VSVSNKQAYVTMQVALSAKETGADHRDERRPVPENMETGMTGNTSRFGGVVMLGLPVQSVSEALWLLGAALGELRQ
jgi:hypothetical protein